MGLVIVIPAYIFLGEAFSARTDTHYKLLPRHYTGGMVLLSKLVHYF